MSKRYPGNFITGNPVALSQTSNSGIWDLKDQYQAQNNGTWQEVDGIYEIPRSLRFRGASSANLSRTPVTSGNRKVWTWSAWVKRGQLESSATDRVLFSSPSQSGNDGIAAIYFNGDQLHTYYDTSGTNPYGPCGPAYYRDPSAWYHIVWAVDAVNTIHKVYVNNVLVSTDTSKYPPNYDYAMNRAGYTHTMGTQAWGPTNYFDGYMAEVNFVDGQFLDPSYFGYTDAITGIWQPKRYTGAYGTNGFYILGNTTPETNYANYIGGANSGNYLTAPYSSDFALTNSDFTLEAFIFASEAFSANDHCIFNFGENVTSVNGKSLIFTGVFSGSTSPARSLRIALSSNGSTNDLVNYVEVGNIELYTWNHVAITRTGGYIYVNINGKRVYSYNIGSTSLYNQTTYGPSIASYRNNGSFGASSSWPGAISNVRFTIGQCLYTGTTFTVPTAPLTTTSQGATSSNVKLLCCQSSTAAVDNSQYARTLTNVGTASFVDYAMSLTDRSGNLNTWSFNNQLVLNLPGNRSTANWDIMVDSPTNVFTSATDVGGVVPGNYCTINSAMLPPGHNSTAPFTTDSGGATTTEGNLTIYRTQNANYAFGTIPFPAAGKWYWEYTVRGGTRTGFGITNNIRKYSSGGGDMNTVGDYGYQWEGAQSKAINGSVTSAGSYFAALPTTNDIIGCAYDADNGTMYFSKGGTWGNSGNPATGTNPLITGIPSATTSSFFVPMWAGGGDYPSSATLQGTFNFGQRAFNTAPPAGFKSLNTTNLQALGTSAVGKAAIQANKWFDTTLYGGTGAARNVENSGFQPDMIWIKDRNAAQWHNITDSARGAGVELFTNATNAEETNGGVASLNPNGFSLINWDGANKSTDSYVAWQWKQSPTSGFNIVPYAGSAAGAQSITHNLGVAPSMMIIKCRTAATTQAWAVYHSSIGATKYAILNTTAEAATGSTYWNNTAPTSSVFTVGTHNDVNIANSAYTYIAYLWAEVPGFSKFGSYTGNGATDGTFVYTGFRPKFVLTKCSSGYASYWTIMDTTRDPFNDAAAQALWPNATDTESAAYNFDILSNGFKIRATTATLNQSGATYIYAAFAESPFGLNNRAR